MLKLYCFLLGLFFVAKRALIISLVRFEEEKQTTRSNPHPHIVKEFVNPLGHLLRTFFNLLRHLLRTFFNLLGQLLILTVHLVRTFFNLLLQMREQDPCTAANANEKAKGESHIGDFDLQLFNSLSGNLL